MIFFVKESGIKKIYLKSDILEKRKISCSIGVYLRKKIYTILIHNAIAI